MSNNNTPRLRFPGFEGEWEEKKLGDITFNEDSKRRPITKTIRVKGEIPYYGANGIQDYVCDYIFDGNYLLVGEDGSVLTANNTPVINWASGKFWVNNHAHVLSQKDSVSLKLISYILSRKSILGLVTGIPPKLNQENLNNIIITIPTNPSEQQKIASCLSEMDNLIASQGQKVESLKEKKKGLMQQLFPQNGESTPRLRFPEFEGEWEEKKLGEVCNRIIDKVGNRKLEPISISAGIGVISQKQRFGKNISGSQYKNYIHIFKGDYCYNKGNSKRFPQGCVYELKDFEEAAAPNAFISFRFKDTVCSHFFNGYFDNNTHGIQLAQYITSGARSDGLLNLSAEDFFKIKFFVPTTIEEQQKIASFLSELDNLIAAESDKLENLENYKKGLMQQLFPQPVK